MNKKDYRNVLILIIFGLLIISGIFISGNIFGSNMDWINQHTVIPEYFRQYFYETKKFVPDIIYNLGLGQNAFNFSYYGLFNPIILISYLLPFINMTTYVMASSIILYLLSIYLFYKFLRPKFDIKLTILLTLIFMCASPILFQFHRQIMFVNYLPFLIMALINIDNYGKTSSKIFLILNIIGMIFSSYYFGVGGILTILIYYIYVNFNKSIKDKLKIFIPIIISVLSSAVLLIPSLISILNGRTVGTSSINLLNLFIPNFNYSDILYGSYALGLSSVVIISIVYMVIKKDKPSKFLGLALIILISFPIFRYLLNGGLYIRSKVLIPFIPIIILCIGYFLNDLFNEKVNLKRLIIIILSLVILGLFNFNIAYYLDLCATLIILFLYYKFKKQYLIICPLVLISIITVMSSNLDETYISMDEYQQLEQNKNIITELIKEDSSFYRISELKNTLYDVNRNYFYNHFKTSLYSSTINPYYKNFYYDVLNINNNNYNNLILRDTNNIIFNKLTGVKYVLSDENPGLGYTEIDNYIYQNEYALSLGYASGNIYSINDFYKLNYPYNLKYLLNGIVVEETIESNESMNVIEEYNLDLLNIINNYIPLTQKNGSYYFDIESPKSFSIELDNNLKDKLLFITINGLESNSCSNDDISITINGQENSLSCSTWWYHNQNYTFNYLINENNLSELNIVISKGKYKIDSINLYTMDIKYLNTNFDEMINIQINKNQITGNIIVTEDGYMTLSLPYDNNFQVFVDDKQVKLEKVNTAFIGFKITEGNHKIKVIYKAPGLFVGRVVSMFGLLLLVIYLNGLLKIKNKFAKIK